MHSPRSLRWRRHWKVAVGFPLAIAVLVAAFGAARVRALSSSERTPRPAAVVDDVAAGEVDLFDTSKVHTISLTYRVKDYERMLDQFFTDGTKDFIPADVTIDGTTVRNVGIRLKGNASLAALRSPDGRVAPASLTAEGDDGAVTTTTAAASGAAADDDLFSTADPQTLPWLVRFNEFGSDQRYQGHREIALRIAPKITTATGLNEAMSLSLLADHGDAAAKVSYSTVRVNGGAVALRLVLENPDEQLAAEDFPDGGALYKALSTGTFAYRGEDPLAYEDAFRQITGKGQQDLQPVIDLVKWANEASDEEFAAGLASRVDIASFARYVAWQDLLGNTDDMAGPGQNYLLFYDILTDRFTVATWDMNLALDADADAAPLVAPTRTTVTGLGGHVLKERFLATSAFRDDVYEAYRDLYRTYFAGGKALQVLERFASTLTSAEGIDAATRTAVERDVATVRKFFTARTAALATSTLIRNA